jgi:hypothetical protein
LGITFKKGDTQMKSMILTTASVLIGMTHLVQANVGDEIIIEYSGPNISKSILDNPLRPHSYEGPGLVVIGNPNRYHAKYLLTNPQDLTNPTKIRKSYKVTSTDEERRKISNITIGFRNQEVSKWWSCIYEGKSEIPLYMGDKPLKSILLNIEFEGGPKKDAPWLTARFTCRMTPQYE